MPGVLTTGHRRRGSGFTVDSIPDFERAIVFSRHKGRTVYVDSAAAAGGNGDSWSGAYTTLAAAVSAALVDDYILVAAGHTESVIAAGTITVAKAGVRIVGMGFGTRRPTITFTTANTATITISAANVLFANIIFVANFANVASAITIGAAKGFTVQECDFIDTDSTHNFLCCVTTGSTNNDPDSLAFLGNYVYGLATTDGAVISMLANALGVRIEDNIVDKAATNDAGHLFTLSSKIMGGIRVLRNYVTVVGSAGAAVGVLGTGSGATSSGIIADNYLWSLDTTGGLLTTASTGIRFHNNFMSGAVDASGTLTPVADNPA